MSERYHKKPETHEARPEQKGLPVSFATSHSGRVSDMGGEKMKCNRCGYEEQVDADGYDADGFSVFYSADDGKIYCATCSKEINFDGTEIEEGDKMRTHSMVEKKLRRRREDDDATDQRN